MHIEEFKSILRRLCTEVENLTIENLVYFDAILESGTINLPALKERVAEALLDSERRKDAHQMYSEMWKAVEDTALYAFFEDQLNSLPPTDKLN